MGETIATQPVPAHTAAALDALYAIDPSGDDLEVAMRAAAAAAVLSNVTPPYPPPPILTESLPGHVGVQRALAALEEAIETADSAAAAVRAGAARAVLQGAPVDWFL